jgi:2'-5' RNA ligase
VAGFATEPFAVDHFSLFRSHLGHGGPHYEELARYPLM